jgi:hypothetical protein
MSFAGETASSKLDRARESLSQRRDGPDWIYLLPTLPAIAWLLNIRCPTDIPFCPVPYAYLGLTQDACVLFVDGKKVEDGSEVQNELKDAGVDVRGYGVDEVGKWVKESLSKMKEGEEDKKKVVKLWAPNECSWALNKACEDVSGERKPPSHLAPSPPLLTRSYRLRSTSSHAPSSRSRESRTPSSNKGTVTPISATEELWYIQRYRSILTLTLAGQVDVVARADPRRGPTQGRGMGCSSDVDSLPAGRGALCVGLGLRSSARSCEGVDL